MSIETLLLVVVAMIPLIYIRVSDKAVERAEEGFYRGRDDG